MAWEVCEFVSTHVRKKTRVKTCLHAPSRQKTIPSFSHDVSCQMVSNTYFLTFSESSERAQKPREFWQTRCESVEMYQNVSKKENMQENTMRSENVKAYQYVSERVKKQPRVKSCQHVSKMYQKRVSTYQKALASSILCRVSYQRVPKTSFLTLLGHSLLYFREASFLDASAAKNWKFEPSSRLLAQPPWGGWFSNQLKDGLEILRTPGRQR